MENKFMHAGFQIEIEQDMEPMDPRKDFDGFGKLLCSHKRYTLGDEHAYKASDFHTWAEWQGQIEEDFDVAVLLPVYMLDHSGLTISTTPFSCPWDSGQIGFIFCTNKQVLEEFAGDTEKARQCLLGEVATYDQFLRGDVWCYIIRTPSARDGHGEEIDGEVVESCGGFFGYEYCVTEAKSCAEACRKHADKNIIDEEQAALALFN
jgi:hypothetical protein